MKRPVHLLIAEDDDEDFELLRASLAALGVPNPVTRVKDGEELLDFLYRRAPFADPPELPWPLLVLVDLRMPKLDGLEALARARRDARMKRVPFIVLTTSESDSDIARAYDAGANAYLKKPLGLDALGRTVGAIKSFWLDAVEPARERY